MRIGIIDSGVDGDHIDLGGPEFPNSIKLVGGYNYADGNNSIGDAFPYEHGHGTGTAGIAAALTNNSFGIAGVAGGWGGGENGPLLYSLKIWPDGSGMPNYTAALRAIMFGSDPDISEVSFGCHILNCSILGNSGYGNWSYTVYFAYSVGANVVAARGNHAPNVYFPACLNERNWVISVGAYGKDGKFSNGPSGNGMDLLAPGELIPFTSNNGDIFVDPRGRYTTSYAAPQVSGAIALLRSSDWGLDFDLTNEDYEWILKYSAFDPSFDGSDGDNRTLSDRYGHGQLRISVPIERLTDPSWSLTEHTAAGYSYYTTSGLMHYTFNNAGGGPLQANTL